MKHFRWHTDERTPDGQKAQSRHEVFLKIIKANERMIKRIAGRFCTEAEERNELIQDIIYRAWESFSDFRQDASPTTWLYSIASRIAKRVDRHTFEWTEFAEDIPEAAAAGDHDLAEELHNAGVSLEADKEIVSLLVQGYSFQEVSNILGIAPHTLRNRVYRLKQRLESK